WLICEQSSPKPTRKPLTSLGKKSPTSKREGAPAPVKVGDEFRLAIADEYDRLWFKPTPLERREA
ncbi:hypothetical protein P9762_08505, partial [Geobacillus stearothermophilus]|uniref:hypothetical protein n=1 Tax=Geobacillus stearothermophilus TaxID=1422 RepID=UPI002E1C395E|nr:hypothetical protein [Geobacillus stearothermophilus]